MYMKGKQNSNHHYDGRYPWFASNGAAIEGLSRMAPPRPSKHCKSGTTNTLESLIHAFIQRDSIIN